jgi:hypothetical protein
MVPKDVLEEALNDCNLEGSETMYVDNFERIRSMAILFRAAEMMCSM